MTPEERKALFVPGTRAYKKPIDVVVQKAEKRVSVRRDGNDDPNLELHYDHPLVWHDGGHVHNIPWAALADRAVRYGLDPDSETFLADVLEHIIYERHHPDALNDARGLLPNGVNGSVRKSFKVDRKSLTDAAEPLVDVLWVKQHARELEKANNIGHAELPDHLQRQPPEMQPPMMNYDKIV